MQKPRVHLSVPQPTKDGLIELADRRKMSESEMGSRLLEKAVAAELKKTEWRGKPSDD